MPVCLHKKWMPFAYCSIIIRNKRQNCSLNQVIKSNGKCSFRRLGRSFMAFEIDNGDNENIRMHKWNESLPYANGCVCVSVCVCAYFYYTWLQNSLSKTTKWFLPFLSFGTATATTTAMKSVQWTLKMVLAKHIHIYFHWKIHFELVSILWIEHISRMHVSVCVCPFIQNDIFKIDVPMYSWECVPKKQAFVEAASAFLFSVQCSLLTI